MPGDSNSKVEFLCGWCAGCVETCILYPQNKLIFRQQLLGVVVKDAVAQVRTFFSHCLFTYYDL